CFFGNIEIQSINHSMKSKIPLLILVFAFILDSNAQKKPIDHSVYDNWQSISKSTISKSGNFLFYTISPQEGDAKTVLKDSKNNTLIEISRTNDVKLNKNERFLITRVNPTYEEIRSAKIKKVKEDKMPKDSLFIFNIKNKSKNIFTHIKSIQTAPTIVNYIAFQSESSVPDSL